MGGMEDRGIDEHAILPYRMDRFWKLKKDQGGAWVEVRGAANPEKKGSDE